MESKESMMRFGHRWLTAMRYPLALALLSLLVAVDGAQAHHVMGGGKPATLVEGLLSGLGHPVIGMDHLAFVIAVGLVAGIAGLSLLLPALFIAASAVGVALHVAGIELPKAELVVAASVLLVGALIAMDAKAAGRHWLWAALFGIAGLFHGYAYGESIFGAESTPLLGYLAGLVLVQAAIATGVALLARRDGAASLRTRLAGAAIAGVGIAVLAGQVLPA
jgi:urease accessory protein